MKALELLARAESMGASIRVDGSDLVLSCRETLPDEFIEELRRYKSDVLAALNASDDPAGHPTTCRGCTTMIQSGTTLCTACGSARSPLVRYAVELAALAQERTLRGRALLALDKRGYPRLQLSDDQTGGPGLVRWCAVLRDAETPTLEAIVRMAAEDSETSTPRRERSEGVNR